jgi:hypothetical protein
MGIIWMLLIAATTDQRTGAVLGGTGVSVGDGAGHMFGGWRIVKTRPRGSQAQTRGQLR